MKAKPSEDFIAAIQVGYRREAEKGNPVTPSAIWDQVVFICLRMPRGFETMFAWDTSRKPNQSRNRIETIMETVRAGYVPGLRMEGHCVVEV